MTRRWTTVAVTGAGGRLGTALLATLAADPDVTALPWRRPDLDLDDLATPGRLVARDRPSLVIHAAAWTDVDGCAREPDLAMRRNGDATIALAQACADAGIPLALISTNEVFDGERTDRVGYVEIDATAPRNPYGRSKLAGEAGALRTFAGASGLWIIRVAWLYGPPGNDFPDRIVAAADRLPTGAPLRVVEDEVGTPTSTEDLAPAILRLLGAAEGGTFHLAPDEPASRLAWASAVLAGLRPDRAIEPVSRTLFTRASDPPPWGVLDAGRAAALGIRLPGWRDSLARTLAGRSSVPSADG